MVIENKIIETSPTTQAKINSCPSESLEEFMRIQNALFFMLKIPEEERTKYILEKGGISEKLRGDYCPNVCPNRYQCDIAQDYGETDSERKIINFLNFLINPTSNNDMPYEVHEVH